MQGTTDICSELQASTKYYTDLWTKVLCSELHTYLYEVLQTSAVSYSSLQWAKYSYLYEKLQTSAINYVYIYTLQWATYVHLKKLL